MGMLPVALSAGERFLMKKCFVFTTTPQMLKRVLHFQRQVSVKNSCRSPSSTGFARDFHVRSSRNSRGRSLLSTVVSAVEKDSEFEFDSVKAREALRKLDEELQSISQKKTDPTKITASDLDRMRGPFEEGSQEISGSFLTNLAIGLVIFTIFYNILFLTVIKPAIDGPDDPVMEEKSNAL